MSDNNAVWKLGYITDVLKAFRDGAKISAKKRREFADQATAYADDVVAAIAAQNVELSLRGVRGRRFWCCGEPFCLRCYEEHVDDQHTAPTERTCT